MYTIHCTCDAVYGDEEQTHSGQGWRRERSMLGQLMDGQWCLVPSPEQQPHEAEGGREGGREREGEREGVS